MIGEGHRWTLFADPHHRTGRPLRMHRSSIDLAGRAAMRTIGGGHGGL